MNDFIDRDLPYKIDIQHHHEHIKISYKWFDSKIVIITVFSIVWDSVIFGAYSSMESDAGLVQKLSLLLYATVGIAITYYAIAGWFNKTNIFVSRELLEIQYRPIPWAGNKRFQVGNIEQLYSRKKRLNNDSGTIKYAVHLVSRNGNDTVLIGGFETSEQALFVEQEVEKYLGIEGKDKPIKWIGYKTPQTNDIMKLLEKGPSLTMDDIEKLVKKK